MNIWKALASLQKLGILLTFVGDLLKRSGEVLTGPNLEPPGSPPVADDNEKSQDPLPQGGADEKPEGSQTSFFFIGGNEEVTDKKE